MATNTTAGGDPLLARTRARPLAGRYVLESQIGRGAAATVYRARDLKHDREVAIKVLDPEIGAAIGAERFVREIALLAKLQHPHILPLYDSGEDEGALYFVMPLVTGETLRDRLTRERQLPILDAVRIAREIADALACAHEQGIIHRDIKPENVLLSGGHAVVADFGVALATSRVPGRRLTDSGLAIGTPSYMSPEQASGDEVDERTDIYSLGCVLYEMLAGEPPFAGASAQAIVAQRFTDEPKSVRRARSRVSPALDRVVTTALARVPADRFASARALGEALAGVDVPEVTGARGLARETRRRWFAAGAAATVVLGVLIGNRMTRPEVALDESLHVIVPFAHRGDAAPALLNGDNCESLLYEALSRWRDLRLVDMMRVHDAEAQSGGTPQRLAETLTLAQQLGAGRLVWGEVWTFGDSVNVRAVLYDARSGVARAEHTVRIASNLSDAPAKFDSLADALMAGSNASPDAARGARGTRTIAAWRAYERGHEALARWQLDSAKREFASAIGLDPEYADAHLWLAQTMAFAGDSESAMRASASFAAAHGDRLSPRDRTIADALAALADERYPDACARYRAVLATDPRDFAALFGLGDCQARDPVVVRDASSPTGWRFRSSYHSAIQSFERALALLPSVQLAFRGAELERLQALLRTDANSLRGGVSLPDSARFAAFPSLEHDTLAYVPWPLADIAAARPGTVPGTLTDAVASNRARLRAVTARWLEAFPDGEAALYAHARVLESLGAVAGTDPRQSALAAARAARAAAATEREGRAAALLELRLFLKTGAWVDARALADTLLAATPATPAEADALAPVAALVGRAQRAADLLRLAAPEHRPLVEGRVVTIAAPAVESGRALLAYASLEPWSDSVAVLMRRTDTLITRWVEPSQRDAARRALLTVPAALAFGHARALPVAVLRGDDFVVVAQQALARGDSATARRVLDDVLGGQRALRPGDVTLDAVYLQAELALALGDTVAVMRRLDAALGALGASGASLTMRVPESAALVRMMVLRAELAARAGDGETTRRWAEPVRILWSGADPELRSVVARVQSLAGGAR